MKINRFTSACLFLLLPALQAGAATLGVTASATPSGAVYNYTYSFAVTGSGTLNDLYLGSNDLSPLSLTFTVDGASTTAWSWLGNDTPQNYLQFFSTTGSLASGDTLGVKFTSSFAPAANEFAIGLNSSTGATTNEVMSVLAPNAATPEPAAAGMLVLGALGLFGISEARKRRAA